MGEARTYLQEKRVGALESGHRVARQYRLAAGRSTEGGGTLGSLRLNHRMQRFTLRTVELDRVLFIRNALVICFRSLDRHADDEKPIDS
jgi:hypothetical protein